MRKPDILKMEILPKIILRNDFFDSTGLLAGLASTLLYWPCHQPSPN